MSGRNLWGQSFCPFLLCWWVLLIFFSLAAYLSVTGAEQVGGKYVTGAGSETQMPIALYINFPLSRARFPPAASWYAAAIPMSVCPSAACLSCMLPPFPSLPPASSQTKVGDAFFLLLKAVGEQLSWNNNSLIENKCWHLQGARKKAAQEV